MNKDLAPVKFCPFCSKEGTIKLKEENRTHIVGDKILKGLFLFYECCKCKERFTTTESDTISINNFK